MTLYLEISPFGVGTDGIEKASIGVHPWNENSNTYASLRPVISG